MFTDSELLRQYVKEGSEAAFTDLVHRYGALVYSAALRSTNGNGHLAEEITQDVFILLVRKAPMLVRHETLAGWLHTTTRFVSLRALHQQRHREIREQEAAAMQTITAPDISWEQLRPLLDEAVGSLDDPDRNAVLLRYFQGCSHREVGAALGLNEDAARMKTERAVEKLHRHFTSRGVITSATLLAEALTMNSVQAAPAGLIGQVATNSFNHGRTLGLAHLLLKAFYMTTTTKIILTTGILAATFATGWVGAEYVRSHASPPAKSTTAVRSVPPLDLLAQARAELAKDLHAPGRYSRYPKIRDYVEGLDATTVKALLSELAEKPLDSHYTEEFDALISRWAKLDPQGALAWTQNLHDPNMKSYGIEQIFDAWSTQDPAAALAGLLQTKGASASSYARVEVIENYALQNPQAALTALRSLPGSWPIEIFFEVWADQDPSAAAAAALTLPPSGDRAAAQTNIASAWAEQDPSSALAYAKSLPAGAVQSNAISSVLMVLSEVDPATAADDAINLNLPANRVRDNLLDRLTTNWAKEDPTALLTWADKNLTGTNYDTAAKAALTQMSISDPAATVAALATLADPIVVNQAIPTIAANWAQQDVQGALEWAQSLPADNTAVRKSAIAIVFDFWTSSDPVAAATYVQQNLAADPSLGNLVTQMAGTWGMSNPQAAFDWAQSLPAGTAQNNAIVAAITSLASVDSATAWYDAQQLSSSISGKAEVNVINAWASQQPAQAAAALQNIPAGQNLDTATGNVAKSWLNQDPAAASDWINTLPLGSARDSAVTQIISNVGANDPVAAFNWAVTIGDSTARNTQVVKLATQWSKQNAAAAATAIQGVLNNLTGLTAAQQTALQKIVDGAAAP